MKANHCPDERLVFIDLETAGGETWRPIMQLAVVVIGSNNNELEAYEAKLRFRESIADQRTLQGSRYTREVWKRCAKSAHCVAHELSDLLKRHATIDQTARDGRVFQVAQLVAHNAAFDGEFLKAWFSRMEVFFPASPRILCTVQRAMWAFHENKSLTPPDDFKLETLCAYFGIPFPASKAHDALTDVRATVALYNELTSSPAIPFREPSERRSVES